MEPRYDAARLPEPAGDNAPRGSGRFVPEPEPDLVVLVSFGRPMEALRQARFTPFEDLDGSPTQVNPRR